MFHRKLLSEIYVVCNGSSVHKNCLYENIAFFYRIANGLETFFCFEAIFLFRKKMLAICILS